MKQTAVEWLIKQIEEKNNGVSNGMTYPSIFEQAREMEKEQLIDCGNTCALMQYIHVDKVSQMSIEEVEKLAEEDNITFGEQYYNETFKSEQDNEQI
jgi:hypothetical protein